MTITFTFNQFIAVILVAMLLVLVIAVLMLLSRISRAAGKVEGLAGRSETLMNNVNDKVNEASDVMFKHLTSAGTLITAAYISIAVLAVENRIRRLFKRR